MRYHSFPLLLALAALLLGCKKSDPATPGDQLPPATQTGAGTFGCLINGQAWLPSGNDGTSNFRVTYDPGYHGGSLQIKCYRYPNKNTYQGLTFGAVNVSKAGAYVFGNTGDNGVAYLDGSQTAPCNTYDNSNPNTYQNGSLTLTRFDLTQNIVSGTFSFKLYQPGCATLKITQGRFDCTL